MADAELAAITAGVEDQAKRIIHELLPAKIMVLDTLHTRIRRRTGASTIAGAQAAERDARHARFVWQGTKGLEWIDASTTSTLVAPVLANVPLWKAHAAARKRAEAEATAAGVAAPAEVAAPDGLADVPCNAGIRALLATLKAEILELVSALTTLRFFVRLMMPRIEDGNNFGVGVQEELLGMLNSGRVSGLGVLKTVTKYFFNRGRVLTDIKKNPGVPDFVMHLRDLDEQQYVNLVTSVSDLRNNYTMLYDKLVKNEEKLLRPKGVQSHTAAMGMY